MPARSQPTALWTRSACARCSSFYTIVFVNNSDYYVLLPKNGLHKLMVAVLLH